MGEVLQENFFEHFVLRYGLEPGPARTPAKENERFDWRNVSQARKLTLAELHIDPLPVRGSGALGNES